MEIWSPAPEHIVAASRALREGRLIGLPTETVYGLAGNALDEQAVASIFSAKRRPTFDPLIVHAPDRATAFALVREVPAAARRLAEAFWPGALTLVLPRRPSLPDLLSAGLDTVAIRVPAHPVAQALLHQCGLPLAAPSANRFGGISPTCARHVVEELGECPEVAGVLDAGPCLLGLESTVLAFPAPDRVVVLRLGALAVEHIEEVAGPVEVLRAFHAVDDPERVRRGEQSPGMLARHYAPNTPLTLLDEHAEPPSGRPARCGFLRFSQALELPGVTAQELLSPSGDLTEAATRLFAALRRLDQAGLDALYAWRVPDQGLGRAINDRLHRASS